MLKIEQVVKLDIVKQKAILDNGWEIGYDKCLIATGGHPKNLPALSKAGPEVEKRTTLFRTVCTVLAIYLGASDLPAFMLFLSEVI